MRQNRNVEQDIVDAARKVFQEKGYKEAAMRDIAAEATINMAMLHYYFRSKENMFYIVFDEAFKMLYEKIAKIVTNEELDIFDKIRTIVCEYITFFNENPCFPQFIMGEVIRNPEKIAERMRKSVNTTMSFNIFSQQLQKEFEKGVIRKISALSLILNIMSLCVFPAIAKPIIVEVIGLKESALSTVFESRKKEVAEFIIRAVKA